MKPEANEAAADYVRSRIRSIVQDPKVAEALDCVFLVRLHSKIFGGLADADPAWRDVSGHPDIAELYLAADVLVTDYSSAMFDFAVTGKPIALYAYDLDRYRDEVRGFYFDLFAAPPGPVVRTQHELFEALRQLPGLAAENADRYAAFRGEFTYLEDGHATDRVLEWLDL